MNVKLNQITDIKILGLSQITDILQRIFANRYSSMDICVLTNKKSDVCSLGPTNNDSLVQQIPVAHCPVYVFYSESVVTVTHFCWLLPYVFSSESVVTVTQFWWLYCCNQIALCDWNWLRTYLTALANFTVVKKQYPCNGCYVTCMFCNTNRFGGTQHQQLTHVHDKTEVGILLCVLTQLWGQINPLGFQTPVLDKYYDVFRWIKYFEFEFD